MPSRPTSTTHPPPAQLHTTAAGPRLTARQRWLSPAILTLIRLAALVYFAALIAATHYPKLPTHGGLEHPLLQVDKIGHVLAFALLAALGVAAQPLGRRAPARLTLLVACGLSLAVAWGIEQTQGLVPGRTPSYADLVAGAGGILGLYVTVGARPLGPGWGVPVWLVRGLMVIALPPLVSLTLSPWGLSIMRDWGWLVGMHPATDKANHFYVAMLITWALALAAPLGRSRAKLNAAAVAIAVGISGPAIELLQPHFGRGAGTLGDLWAHMQGVVLGLAGWAAMATLRSPISYLGAWLAPLMGLTLGRRAGRSDEAGDGQALAGHASLISGLTLVSRLTGLVRDATLAAIFGVSMIADAFFIGFLVPNLFRRLFGEGAITAAFIPRYSELLSDDPKRAHRLAGVTLAGLAVVLGTLTLLGELGLWLIWRGQGSESPGGLALELTMWMLPYMPLVCLVALIGGILQVHRRFGPPAAVPVVLNLAIIAGAGIASVWTGPGESGLRQVARVAAVAVIVAGVAQLAWQLLALRAATQVSFSVAGIGEPMRRLIKALVPLLLGLAVFQINAFFDSLVALVLSAEAAGAQFMLLGWQIPYPMETGAVASLQWAQRLYQFPLGVFGIAVATAIFPALAEAAAGRGQGQTVAASNVEQAAAEGNPSPDRLGEILRQGLRLTFFIGLPASAGLMLVRLPLVRTIYERGAFAFEDSGRVATILAGYAAAVWAYSVCHVLTRCFYAVGDERSPVRIGLVMVGLNVVLNLTLIWAPLAPMGGPLGVAGLAWSTAICAAAQAVWLLHRVRRHVSEPVNAAVWRSWSRTVGLTVLMSVILAGVVAWVKPATLSWSANAGMLAGLVGLGAAIIFGGAWLTRAEEVTWLLGPKKRP
jgi:putative peptidoglycan lipid II flippase